MENAIILENRELRTKSKTMRRELEIMKQKIAMLEMQMYNQSITVVPNVYMQPAKPVLPSSLPPSSLYSLRIPSCYHCYHVSCLCKWAAITMTTGIITIIIIVVVIFFIIILPLVRI